MPGSVGPSLCSLHLRPGGPVVLSTVDTSQSLAPPVRQYPSRLQAPAAAWQPATLRRLVACSAHSRRHEAGQAATATRQAALEGPSLPRRCQALSRRPEAGLQRLRQPSLQVQRLPRPSQGPDKPHVGHQHRSSRLSGPRLPRCSLPAAPCPDLPSLPEWVSLLLAASKHACC